MTPSCRTTTTRKGQKFCTLSVSIHFQMFFQLLHLRNVRKCSLKRDQVNTFHHYSFSCLPPQTTKKKINNFFGSAHLHPIDFAYQEVSNYSVKSHTFYPKHLDSRFPEERSSKRNCF